MGTNFVYAQQRIGAVTVSSTLTVTTGAAQQFYASSGAIMVVVECLGPTEVSFGDTGITATSGNVLFPYEDKTWYPVGDDFSQYLRATSVASVVKWTDYYPG